MTLGKIDGFVGQRAASQEAPQFGEFQDAVGDSHGFGESACIVQFPLMPLAVMNGEQAKIGPLCQKLVSQYGGVEPS